MSGGDHRRFVPWSRRSGLRALSLVVSFVVGVLAHCAAAAPFDLAGPDLQVSVTRAGRTLPIAEVPNLAVGDEIAITPKPPPGEPVRYLLVATFLRGATNPPPESWFAWTAAWKPKASLRVVVPAGAEQALIFLAPQTGGGFRTLRSAVRARPGAFVRAAQELGQASLDRSRLDLFTAQAARINQADPGRLETASRLLARSLGIRIDQACLTKVTVTQASCLTQDRDALVLDDSSRASPLLSLASGYSAELVRELSSTPWAGSGNYSPYVASLFDILHLFDASRTAQYQYIPALSLLAGERLSLLLNAPPSFRNPQSVLVAALPPVSSEEPPKLHPIEPAAAYCAVRPDLVLPMDGAPLVFSTSYAHDLRVRLIGKSGVLELPARANPERGGILVDASAAAGQPALASEGQLIGGWGFAAFEGPRLQFDAPKPQAWSAGGARPSLVVGQESTLQLVGGVTVCIENIRLQSPSGAETPLAWSASGPNEMTIHLPPKPAGGGDFKLMIRTFGVKAVEVVPLGVYSRPSQVANLIFHMGDRSALLIGERLDEVQDVLLEGERFAPAPGGANSEVRLELAAANPQGLERLSAGDVISGRARLKDGRSVPFRTTVAPARPQVAVISRNLQAEGAGEGLPIRLGGLDAMPRRSTLTFAVRAQSPMIFTGRETLQVETSNGAFAAELTAADGLMLQDPQVAVASLDLQRKFVGSAFGPLQFRFVKDDIASDWQPLGVLVRLPQISGVACPAEREGTCALRGSKLFLIAAVAASPTLEEAVAVPDGFAGDSLKVPRPRSGRLYLRLRDNPTAVDILMLPQTAKASRAGKSPALEPAAR
jgi:hypothetical protein